MKTLHLRLLIRGSLVRAQEGEQQKPVFRLAFLFLTVDYVTLGVHP